MTRISPSLPPPGPPVARKIPAKHGLFQPLLAGVVLLPLTITCTSSAPVPPSNAAIGSSPPTAASGEAPTPLPSPPLDTASRLSPSRLPTPRQQQLQAVHQHGQTFLTWPENGAHHFLIYRALDPNQSLDTLTPIATVGRDSGLLRRASTLPDAPHKRLVITDGGPEIPPGVGVYVHTPDVSEAGISAWYAVVGLDTDEQKPTLAMGSIGGTRSTPQILRLDSAVLETNGTPQPVLAYTSPGGRQRLYTQFMDDGAFSREPAGLAFQFWVGLPPQYTTDPTAPLPLTVHLHAWGESWQRFYRSSNPAKPGSPYDFPTIWVEPDDPGNTWWVGSLAPAPGRPLDAPQVRRDTERRLEHLFHWLFSKASGLPIDRDRVYLYGGSMGGTGTLSFGLRHPDWFAALYALTPLIRPATSSWARPGLLSLWGEPPVTALPSRVESLYQTQDLATLLEKTRGADLPFTVTVHGRTDHIIDWKTQGLTWLAARQATGQPGPALFTDGDHDSVFDSFTAALVPNWQPSQFRFARRESYPVFTRFSGDDTPNEPLPACRHADPLYRYGYQGGAIEWGGQGLSVLGRSAPLESVESYTLTLRIRTELCHLPRTGTAEVTLRRRQVFRPIPGTLLRWQVQSSAGESLKAGTVQVGMDGRLMIPDVPVTAEGVVLQVKKAGS